MAKKFIYNGSEYFSEYEVRNAIWKEEGKVFGSPKNQTAWLKLGVKIEDYEFNYQEPKEPNIEELKSIKLADLDNVFREHRESNKSKIESSLGFKVNANTTAFNNVSGLIVQLEYATKTNSNATVEFMDFDDNLRTLTVDDLKIIQLEISKYGSRCYEKKWELREKINQSKTAEDLERIDFSFEN